MCLKMCRFNTVGFRKEQRRAGKLPPCFATLITGNALPYFSPFYIFYCNIILSFNLPPPPSETKDVSVVLTGGDRVGVCGVNQHLLCSNSFKNSGAGRCSEGVDS